MFNTSSLHFCLLCLKTVAFVATLPTNPAEPAKNPVPATPPLETSAAEPAPPSVHFELPASL